MQVIRKNDKSIIRISEHISSDTDIEEITGAVSHEINSGSGHIVISFINVSHPYSAVMSMINRSHSLTSSKGVAFSVVAFKRELIDVLIETRCNRLFGIFRSEQEMETVHLIQQS
jgi:anti-anti-sigma regulatory factor